MIALVPLIALGDYATGYELSLAILYLVPIFAATWVLGRGYGIAISVLALVSWLVSVHFMGFAYAHPFYHLWEALIRLVTWVIVVLLLARLRVARPMPMSASSPCSRGSMPLSMSRMLPMMNFCM